jgi:hypothetical protein
MTLIEILDKNVDQVSLGKDLIVEFVGPKLREYAAKTDNSIDDKIVEAILEFLAK